MFEFVLVNARSFSHLTICTIRVGTDSVLFSLQCTCLVELELEFRVQVFPEGSDSSWHYFTAASLFTPEHCVVFEAVVYRRANIDEEFAQRAAALERLF